MILRRISLLLLLPIVLLLLRRWRRVHTEKIVVGTTTTKAGIQQVRRISRGRSRSRIGRRSGMIKHVKRRLLLLLLRNRCRSYEILIVVVLLIVFDSNARDFGHNPISPGGHRLPIVDNIHPDRHGLGVPITSRSERRLEAKVVAAGEWKGLFDLFEGGWVSWLAGFGSQKDVGLEFGVAVFGDEVAVCGEWCERDCMERGGVC